MKQLHHILKPIIFLFTLSSTFQWISSEPEIVSISNANDLKMVKITNLPNETNFSICVPNNETGFHCVDAQSTQKPALPPPPTPKPEDSIQKICREPLASIPILDRSVELVGYGAFCDSISDYCDPSLNLECVPDELTLKDNPLKGVCRCHKESVNIKVPCNKPEDCAYLDRSICTHFLVDKNIMTKQCGCDITSKYNGTHCQVRDGFPCKPGQCITGAVCNENHRCECQKPDYIAGGGRKCYRAHKASCSSDSECSTQAFLHCSNSTRACECSKGFRWSPSTSTCVALAGSSCSNADCITEAYCDDTYTCKCKSGYSATESQTCKLNYGQACNASSVEGTKFPCNWEKSFTCDNKTGICGCEFPDKQVLEGSRCVSRMGNYCGYLFARHGDWRYFGCVKGAFCYKGICAATLPYEESMQDKKVEAVLNRPWEEDLELAINVEYLKSNSLDNSSSRSGISFCLIIGAILSTRIFWL